MHQGSYIYIQKKRGMNPLYLSMSLYIKILTLKIIIYKVEQNENSIIYYTQQKKCTKKI